MRDGSKGPGAQTGIEVELAYPWITRDYDYAHAAVRLRFFRVPAWRGTLHGREAQQFAWQLPEVVTVSPLLPANGPVPASSLVVRE